MLMFTLHPLPVIVVCLPVYTSALMTQHTFVEPPFAVLTPALSLDLTHL